MIKYQYSYLGDEVLQALHDQANLDAEGHHSSFQAGIGISKWPKVILQSKSKVSPKVAYFGLLFTLIYLKNLVFTLLCYISLVFTLL